MITDEQVERVITTTLEEAPGQDTHWSTRSMAQATGMSQSAISRIWRAFGLKPHIVQTWKLSTMKEEWATSIRDTCQEASVAFFFKLLCTKPKILVAIGGAR